MAKIRTALIMSLLLLACMTGFAANDAGSPGGSLEKAVTQDMVTEKILKIENELAFLRERHADVADIPVRLQELKNKADALKSITDEKELNSSMKIVLLMAENLDMEVSTKESLYRRMELLYIITFIFGIVFIVGIVAYAAYMYTRRRRS